MKRTFLFLSLAIISSSCNLGWSDETKDAFYQACTERAIRWTGTKEVAKTYCDCVYGKMVKKYPNEEDMLEHIDILAKDTDLINCKDEILKDLQNTPK
jgi:hypothetical protein